MPLREQDRAVWVGEDSDELPVGSSGKVREVDGNFVLVDWGGGHESRCRARLGRGGPVEVVTPQQAANRGVEPWASSLPRGGRGDRR